MNVRKSKVLDLGGIKYKVLSGDIVEQEIVELLKTNAAHVQMIIDQLASIKGILCVLGGIDLRGKSFEKKLLSIGVSDDLAQFKEGVAHIESVREFLAERKKKIIKQIRTI